MLVAPLGWLDNVIGWRFLLILSVCPFGLVRVGGGVAVFVKVMVIYDEHMLSSARPATSHPFAFLLLQVEGGVAVFVKVWKSPRAYPGVNFLRYLPPTAALKHY